MINRQLQVINKSLYIRSGGPLFSSESIFMKCTLCATPLIERIDAEYFDCPECRGMVKDVSLYPDAENEKLRYLTHVNDVNDPRYQNFTSPITNYILDHFSKDQEGLDFGCGTGPVISKVLSDAGYRVLQYDPYFANHPENLERSYDYIAACEVVEHFYNPCTEFKRLYDMLNPGGSLAIMTLVYNDQTPFSDWYYRKDPTHVFIYRKETFEYICKQFGFKDWFMDTRLIVLKK